MNSPRPCIGTQKASGTNGASTMVSRQADHDTEKVECAVAGFYLARSGPFWVATRIRSLLCVAGFCSVALLEL